MKTIGFFSDKGGVGKTTSVANTAAAAAVTGLRVLQVSLVHQGDLEESWGLEPGEERTYVEDLLTDPSLDPRTAVVKLDADGIAGSLALLPASGALKNAWALLAREPERLGGLLDHLADDYDVAILDTPGGDTPFGRAALACCDLALATMPPGYFELQAVFRMADLARAVNGRSLGGVLVVNADERWRATAEYREALAAEGLHLYDAVVPRHQPVSEHPRMGQPAVLLKPESRYRRQHKAVVRAYEQFTEQLLGQLEIAPKVKRRRLRVKAAA